MLAFEQLDIFKKPKLAFDDEETRYRHRFKAFADLWNFELPPFEYYKTTTNTSGNEVSKSITRRCRSTTQANTYIIKAKGITSRRQMELCHCTGFDQAIH